MTQYNQPPNRRNFVKGGLVTSASVLATPAIASDKMHLKMVTTWPKNLPGMGVSAATIAKSITDLTDGRVTIKLYAAGERVPAFESFDAVRTGTADLFHGAPFYWNGKNKAFGFFTTLPFDMIHSEFMAWINWGDGQKLYDEFYGEYGLKPFVAGNSVVQMGGWFRKEINSIDDLKGIKMRMPGLGGDVLNKVGANAVALPVGEIFPSLQSGMIDAAKFVGPWQDLNMGFYKVAPYYYYPGFHEPASTIECVFNLDVWQKISKNDQAIITRIIGHEEALYAREVDAKSAQSLDTLINKHGVKLRKFDDSIFQALSQAAKDVIGDVMAENPVAKKVYENRRTFAKDVSRWTELGTAEYLNMRKKFWDF